MDRRRSPLPNLENHWQATGIPWALQGPNSHKSLKKQVSSRLQAWDLKTSGKNLNNGFSRLVPDFTDFSRYFPDFLGSWGQRMTRATRNTISYNSSPGALKLWPGASSASGKQKEKRKGKNHPPAPTKKLSVHPPVLVGPLFLCIDFLSCLLLATSMHVRRDFCVSVFLDFSPTGPRLLRLVGGFAALFLWWMCA